MSKKKLPEVRIEPELLAVKAPIMPLRDVIQEFLDYPGERPFFEKEVRRFLRRVLAGEDVGALLGEKRRGPRAHYEPEMTAAIATEYARLVKDLMAEGKSELAAKRKANALIADRLAELDHPEAAGKDYSKRVQRAVKDWPLHYKTSATGGTFDPDMTVELYKEDLAALDKKTPGQATGGTLDPDITIELYKEDLKKTPGQE